MSRPEFEILHKIYNDFTARTDVGWGVGGGWGIDAYMGQVTRAHDDVDVCLFRPDLLRFAAGWPEAGWGMVVAGDVWVWDGKMIPELPVHELRLADVFGGYEILLLEREGKEWVYRRDARVRLPADKVFVKSRIGITVLNPAIALLFKSKEPRDKDMRDFENVLPFLPPFETEWLMQSLKIVYGDHVWMERLKEMVR